MFPLISIIVPVYRVEKYLCQCIESIINQTYRNLEIILVDDGSPDNCGEICEEYKEKDSRIIVVHKKNGGLSDARNAGLDICTGDYVGFVDSDDWIEPQMYENLFRLLNTYHADIAFGGVVDEIENSGTVTVIKTSNYGITPFCDDKLGAMKRYFLGSWSAWDKLYKREIFDKLRYPVGEINEDEAIVIDILNSCNKVCYTNEIFYHYVKRINNGSITQTSFSEKKLAWTAHCRKNYFFICENYPDLAKYAIVKYRESTVWALNNMALNPRLFRTHILSFKKELKKITLEKNWKENLSAKEFIRIKIILAIFPLYSLMVRMLKKKYQ